MTDLELPILPQWPVTLDQREAMIREAAYFIAEKRGFAPGRELDDWLAGECEIDDCLR